MQLILDAAPAQQARYRRNWRADATASASACAALGMCNAAAHKKTRRVARFFGVRRRSGD